MAPRPSLRRRLRDLGQLLLHEHTSPARLAAAVFVGCVVGTTPLFGLHLVLCLALAWLFGLNKLVVYGAANLSVPPMIPLLGFVSVELGEQLLHRRWLPLRPADFGVRGAREMAAHFFASWMVGGLVLGAAVGAGAAALVYSVLRSRRQGGSDHPVDRAIEAARRRYDGLKPAFRYYARSKYRLDPCYRAIAPHLPPGGLLVDLGAGLGLLPVLAGMLGEDRRALGVEWDRAKAEAARVAARGLDGISVADGDLRVFELPACDVVTLVDVLHYYDADEQRALLGRCRRALRPGGRLLVRDGDPARSGGARFTRWLERAATRLGWNRGPKVRFRPVEELCADLRALGFTVQVEQVAGRFHPGNVLIIGQL